MLKQFTSFIESITESPFDTKYLLAVSGGMDSMAMLYLFSQSNFDFAVANVNFNLRDSESDADSDFVIKYCQEKNIKIHQTNFDTNKYAEEHKISTQMAARDLRYNWFNEIKVQYHYDKIAIAHHLDDQAETFFINILRGTGIAGMHGIAIHKDNIIRPLMFANREQIAVFIKKESIPYREDSSNASDKYQRNYIRHHILSEFKKLRNDFSFSLNQSIKHLSEVEEFANHYLNTEVKNIVEYGKECILRIKIKELETSISPKLILYHILKAYEFKRAHITDIWEIINEGLSGKKVKSSSYELLVDRKYLYLTGNKKYIEHDILLKDGLKDLSWQKALISVESNYQGDFRNSNPNFAFIDFERLKFPLIIRSWQNGDYFYPLGMRGKKKLSDFFIDNKLSVNQKNKVRLLCHGDSIIWIIGFRIDKRYSITEQTKQIIKLEYHGNN